MPKLDLLTISGEKSGTVSLPKEIFAAKINLPLMAQAVRVYLANQRKAHAKTKTRSEVSLTKAKWYRQKGTGRARHGSKTAPIFVGGGIAHGPTGQENYKLKLSQKMRKMALFSALTSKLKDKNILVVKGFERVEPKTKKMAEILAKLKVKSEKKDKKALKILIIIPGVLANLHRAARNIEGVSLVRADLLNTYEILNNEKIIFTKESLEKLKENFLGK